LFVVALDDTHEYLFQDEPEVGPRGNKDKDVSRTTIRRALAQADLVSMSLTRRMFKTWRAQGVVKAITVYSDASPVVGVELQGMLVDIVFRAGEGFRDGDVIRLILPGSTLAYGHTDTISKGMALLWGIWLIAGPTTDDITWFCYNVRSFTTDFGVEMHLLDIPDVAEAMVAWAGGRPLHQVRILVKPDSRLFRRALRIAGWSHTMGGVMKGAAENMPEWPSFLTNMRSLCKFYKNSTYRSHIRRKLELREDVNKSLLSFTAGFAKWRYETVYEVLRQLLGVREVSEMPLPRELVARAQDQEDLSKVMAACRDRPFWRWASASFNKVFKDLERLRRWGMVCECPAHREERRASGGKKFIKCPRIH